MSRRTSIPTLASNPLVLLVLVLAALSVAVQMTGTPLSRVTQIAIYVLYGAGVNLLLGYTGLVPFGASVFFGTASYAAALAALHLVGNEIVGLAVTVAFSVVLAALLGAVVLKRRGLYFSLLTLACSQIAFEIAFKWTDLTGGENGLQNVPRGLFPSFLSFHVFALVTVVAAMWFLWRLAHAPFGRVLQALRDNEQRVASLGYDTYRVKLAAFVISAALIGYAGGLLAFLLQGAYANNLSWQHAGDSLLMTVLGGVHHFLGPLWGAIAFILLEDKLSGLTEHWWLIFAPIIMAFALLSPEGIHGLAQRVLRRERWTLTRAGIPRRPDVIAPYRSTELDADAGTPILTVKGLSKSFGSLVTASNIDLEVHPHRLHSFIGPNGAGKTTFFNMLTGVLPSDRGTIVFDGTDITRLAMHQRIRLGIGRSFQILSVFRNLTVFENVRIAVQARSPLRFGLWRDAHSIDSVNARTWSLLASVGLVERAAEPCTNLSHGEQRLLEIAITLATEAKLLLLDEPLAGLGEADRQVVAALIRQLATRHAVLLIEHDIDRVLSLSDRVTVLHQGRLIADGKPADVAAHPDVIAAYLGAARDGETAVAAPPRAAAANTVGKPLLRLEGVSSGYAGSRILDGLDLVVREGEAVALLGRNGVGKTTTLRTIMGGCPLSAGRITLDGADLTGAKPYEINRKGVSLVPEGRRLFPNLTVMENLRLAARPGGLSVEEVFALFPRLHTRQRAKAENLSGGERQMVAIARALMVPSRVILLDEPFEGLAPAVVKEVMEAVAKLRGRVALVIVEHHAETVLSLVDRAYVLVNGKVAYEGRAEDLERDTALQHRLLGVVHPSETGSAPIAADHS
ncbi:ABC-type branched-subunit amino acid transport system ATPase component/ABC-type branched-subunit amino acid transport system permease subunit [Azospirillum agricola]|uniref:branched-chain amino acid ABC transporter ATP-binding protein/permease n=1 Tax=Azospirillum agricola TaxID=1720247 RepID=UPI001AE53E92|nr:branched-chain amino acid ABC transporter ATP-binding protein/permease [Azospirillum agricola]MBP2228752.1 ABC-type branched-subunit amino acid transport system ATPase component/ABC-type branched-subunit amino acid transport system permease subunit [Azospirillum agricola]